MTAKEQGDTKALLLGNWVCIAATVWLIIGLVCFIGCGCEDDGDTTIYQAGDINIPTNSTTPVIISSGNSGDTDINVTTIDETGSITHAPSIIVKDNEGNTSIETVQISSAPEEQESE